MTETVAPKRNRSNEELRMRELVVAKLRQQFPSARIVHELPLRYSSNRIDLAAITETEIVSVEIKSSKDVADRLEKQVRSFLPVSSRVIVALAPKWNPDPTLVWTDTKYGRHGSYEYTAVQTLLRGLGGPIETWTVSAEAGTIKATDGEWHDNRPGWALMMLDMLWREELLAIAGSHRICLPKRPTHMDARNACEELMTGREIRAAVCRALRRRSAFDKASDGPILPVATETREVAVQ